MCADGIIILRNAPKGKTQKPFAGLFLPVLRVFFGEFSLTNRFCPLIMGLSIKSCTKAMTKQKPFPLLFQRRAPQAASAPKTRNGSSRFHQPRAVKKARRPPRVKRKERRRRLFRRAIWVVPRKTAFVPRLGESVFSGGRLFRFLLEANDQFRKRKCCT